MFIFLDIDGVLNKQSDWKNRFFLNDECIHNFANIFKNTEPKIILSSSWRHGFVGRNNPQNSEPIEQLEKKLEKYGLKIYGKTEFFPGKSRTEEINSYLRQHQDTKKYLIIDDDISEFNSPLPDLYLCDCKTGFTLNDAKKIKKNFKL